MVTRTDTQFAERLEAVVPTNFMQNTSKTYEAMAGFLANMIDRIGRTVVLGQRNVINPFSDWTDPVMDYGDTIQKYCVPFIDGKKPDYDPADPNPYKTVKNPPEVQYIKFNDDVQYKQTIYNLQLRKAFTSASTLGSFTAEQMNSMYNSAGLDQFLKWKKYLSKKDYVNSNGIKAIEYTTEDEYGYAVWQMIKELAEDKLKFPSKNYNAYGMMSASPNFDVIMTAEVKKMVDNSLKGIYNLEKVSIDNINIKVIDSFATVADEANQLDVVILSKGMAHYTPRSVETGSLYNPENYYTNFWYKESGAFSFDPFYNAAQIYRTVAP